MTGERINHKSKGLSPLIFSESVDLTSENASHLLVIELILLYKSKQINYNDFYVYSFKKITLYTFTISQTSRGFYFTKNLI